MKKSKQLATPKVREAIPLGDALGRRHNVAKTLRWKTIVANIING